MAALLCVPASSQTSINNVAGLTGPGALSWKTSLAMCDCLEPDPACTDVCNHVAVCGDEEVDPGEACDGGPCCNANCTLASSTKTCRAAASECDPAERCTGSAATCPVNAIIADGTQCNDHSDCTTGDHCQSGLCKGTKLPCGDGEIDAACGEKCDDGNLDDGDGCSRTCQFQQRCGDANDDGAVTTTDAQRVLQRAVDLPVDCPIEVCDVDSSGHIGTSDAYRVLRNAVQLPGDLVCDYGD
jgi:cysteine-rich repeat protein